MKIHANRNKPEGGRSARGTWKTLRRGSCLVARLLVGFVMELVILQLFLVLTVNKDSSEDPSFVSHFLDSFPNSSIVCYSIHV